MAIFPPAPDQTIAQMWSNGARGDIIRWRNVFHEMCRMGQSLFWSRFDVTWIDPPWTQIGLCAKKKHLRSQWPWPLIFGP